MKTPIFALVLLPSLALAGAVYNCPKHGPLDEGQAVRRGASYACRLCEDEKARKQRTDEAAARADRVARGDLFESDLRHLPSITINTRSFGGTNAFERRCFAPIRDRYIMVDGTPHLRSEFEQTFKIIQPLGGGAYLAAKGTVFFRVETTSEALVNDALVTFVGGFTGEVFDYTTVLGARQRVRVFATLARQGHAVAEIEFTDILAHLNAGGTFAILMPYDPQIPISRGWNPAIEATITQRGGSIVHFGR